MEKITLTEEELNELLAAMQEQITSEYDNQLIQMTKGNYLYNFSTKDGKLVAFGIFDRCKEKEYVPFNIVNPEGKFIFDEEVIFMFLYGSRIIKAGGKNGEVIEIDNII